VLTGFAVLATSVSRGGSINGMVAAPVLPKLGLPGAGLPSQRQVQYLANWLVWILGRGHALAVANAT